MMSATSTETDWGARRERRRRRRRWAIPGVIALTAALFVRLAPSIDTQPAASGARLIRAITFLGIVATSLAWSWRERDEVERHIVINSLAVVGLTSLFLVPIARIAASVLPISDPVLFAWAASAIAGPLAFIWQRVRR